MVVKRAAFLSLTASLFATVASHGFVIKAVVDGTEYKGFEQAAKDQNSAVLITDYGMPIYDVWSNDLTCGINPQAPRVVAPVNAGKNVEWHWVTHPDKNWVHDKGTHRSFIASCNGDCKSANPPDLNWIELGQEYTGPQIYDTQKGRWPAQDLVDGKAWSDTIPNLPAGQYLLRNELTALHYSIEPRSSRTDDHDWGTEFYVTCIALDIQGTDGSFNPGVTWKFPGAYQVDQPGHYNPDYGHDYSHPESVVLAALQNAQGYSNSYSNTPTTGSPALNVAGTPSTSSSAASSSSTHSVCKPKTRRSLAARAKKIRRSHKALRRSEH